MHLMAVLCHTHTKAALQNFVKSVSRHSKRSMKITGNVETKCTWRWPLPWESRKGQAERPASERRRTLASGGGPSCPAPVGSVSARPAGHSGLLCTLPSLPGSRKVSVVRISLTTLSEQVSIKVYGGSKAHFELLTPLFDCN